MFSSTALPLTAHEPILCSGERRHPVDSIQAYFYTALRHKHVIAQRLARVLYHVAAPPAIRIFRMSALPLGHIKTTCPTKNFRTVALLSKGG